MNTKKTARFLCILLLISIISSLCASMIQSSGFETKVIELSAAKNEGVLYQKDGTPSKEKVDGAVESGMLFIPSNATAETPVTGIFLTHGYLNNYQLQLQNAIELSRRGFVVLLADIEGHGNHNNTSNYAAGNEAWNDDNGVYDSIKYLYNLDCVKKSGVGVSAHSMGAECLDAVVALDGEHYMDVVNANPGFSPDGKGLGIISAAIFQGFDPINAAATAEFNDLQGSIDFNLFNKNLALGILKASNDEFFYINTRPDGSATTCPEYLESTHAAIFTRTGYVKGDNSSVNVENGAFYVDGKKVEVAAGEAVGTGFSVIFEDANEIHPLNHMSVQAAGNIVKFFYAAYGVPDGAQYIAPEKQTWWIKEVCTTIGLFCFFLMIFPISTLLLKTPFFGVLKTEEGVYDRKEKWYKRRSIALGKEQLTELKGVRSHITYWLCGLVCALFTALSYTKYYSVGGTYFPVTPHFPQDTTNPLLFWSMHVGLFTIGVILLGYIVNFVINKIKYKSDAAKYTVNPFKTATISGQKLLRTLLLAVTVVAAMYTLVFVVYAVFKVDFRFWHFDVKVFDVDLLLPTILRYMPLFFIFYGANAWANSTYRVKNLPEIATIAINCVLNVIGVAGYLIYDYSNLMATGRIPAGVHPLAAIVIMPLLGMLPAATIISRQLYKKTGNIWLGAFVNTMLATIITVANTAASYAYIFG